MKVWSVNFQILTWSAWAPSLITAQDWLNWNNNQHEIVDATRPATKFLNSNLRRRCSQLTRSCLEAAYHCLTPEQLSHCRAVFGSRHGECQVSQQLLETLAHDEILSPMGFSLSVHNAVAGVFSIAAKNQSPTTSISAGKQSFCYTLLDSLVAAKAEPDRPLLMCFGEELVPESLKEVVEEPRMPFSLAILLKVTDKQEEVTLTFETNEEDNYQQNAFSDGLQYIKWLLSQDKEICFKGKGQQWLLSKKPQPYIDQFRAVDVKAT